jgi:hypothetical protein
MGCLQSIMPTLNVAYLVADSACGTLDYLNIAKAYNCSLISVLSSNIVLYQVHIIDETVKKKAGAAKIYGDKYDLKNISKGTYLIDNKKNCFCVYFVTEQQSLRGYYSQSIRVNGNGL